MNKYLYVIGIDGGGTKSDAILCALDGKILSEAQGGPSNFQIIGTEKAAETILELILKCCQSIRCDVTEIGAIVAGLAGAGRLNDQIAMKNKILELAYERKLQINKLIIESDARIALEGAFSGKPGIVAIAGTGSIVFGKDKNGNIFRAGGWGRIIGDEGSGFVIGKEALHAIARFLDGYGEKTILYKLIKDKFGLSNQEEIIDAVYKKDFPVASIAPLVMEAFLKKDKIAKGILKNACNDLVEVITAVIDKMNKKSKKNEKYNLALVGNLFEGENPYAKLINATIRKQIDNIIICKPESSPVVGASLMALEMLKL